MPVWAYITIGLLGSGTIGTLITLLVKARGENAQVLVTAAKDVVVIQKGELDRQEERHQAMEDRLTRAFQRIERLEQELAGYEALKRHVRTLETELRHARADLKRTQARNRKLEGERSDLLERIGALEDEVDKLKTNGAPPQNGG
jgi:predicted  nucleic acid-binding Zn-ribbon protein